MFGQGNIDLDGVDRRVIEAFGNFGVVFDGRAADIRHEASFGEVEPRKNFINDFVDAGVLQADRVQHAHWCFVNAMRRIAESRLQGCALQNYCADI